MLLARANTSAARRLGALGALLAVSLVAAAGLAWACVPTARTAVSPVSGAGGKTVTMTGGGFPADAVKVDIYLDVKGTGPLLKDDLPMTTGSGGDKEFSTQVTAPTSVGAHLLIPVPLNASNADVGTGTSGAGPPAAVFQVTKPMLAAAPASGTPGSNVTVTGEAFRSGMVSLRWDTADGPVLGSGTATGASFGFSKQVTVPDGAAGDHRIVAVPLGDPADSASAPFRVVAPTPPASADSVGPAIVAAALSSGNGTRVVSKKGDLTLFCGQYDEEGVTGECGARSVAKLKLAGGSRSALKFAAKSFTAQSGEPVKVKFRLDKRGMRMLRTAKRVRMRGTVTARDAGGNATPAVAFGFTLKAPK